VSEVGGVSGGPRNGRPIQRRILCVVSGGWIAAMIFKFCALVER
jgi:hypothetical protein